MESVAAAAGAPASPAAGGAVEFAGLKRTKRRY